MFAVSRFPNQRFHALCLESISTLNVFYRKIKSMLYWSSVSVVQKAWYNKSRAWCKTNCNLLYKKIALEMHCNMFFQIIFKDLETIFKGLGNNVERPGNHVQILVRGVSCALYDCIIPYICNWAHPVAQSSSIAYRMQHMHVSVIAHSGLGHAIEINPTSYMIKRGWNV